MQNTKLRKVLKSIIQEHLETTKVLTSEGIVDSVLNHVRNVLQKTADAKFKGNLAKLAKSGPEGKKAAKHLLKSMADANDIMDTLSDDMASLGW